MSDATPTPQAAQVIGDRLLYSRATLLRILDIGSRTLSRLIERGRFPKPDITEGRGLSWWKPATVERWIEARMATRMKPAPSLPITPRKTPDSRRRRTPRGRSRIA